MRVVFLQCDLLVGGGERNSINLALALQEHGHHVRFLVSHYNKQLSFPEMDNFDITATGDFLNYEFCNYFKALWLGIWLSFFSNWDYNLVYICQFPYPIPIIQWFGKKGARILLHCNYPEKIICPDGIGKTLTGWFWEMFEDWSTKKADMVLVHSNFRVKTFLDVYKSFPREKLRRLYPCVNKPQSNKAKRFPSDLPEIIVPVHWAQSFFLSLNRYDFVKKTDLTIRALDKCWANYLGQKYYNKRASGSQTRSNR